MNGYLEYPALPVDATFKAAIFRHLATLQQRLEIKKIHRQQIYLWKMRLKQKLRCMNCAIDD